MITRSQKLAGQMRLARSSQISALYREQLADIAEFDRAEGGAATVPSP